MGFLNIKVEEMQKKVLASIKKHNLVEPGESVLIGVSGGPDSVCLLHILYSLRTLCLLDINEIIAVHVNHMLRGNESDMDEKYVRGLCSRMGIKLFTVHLNVNEISAKRAISIEEAARSGRYAQFALFAEKVGNCKIAVAHNKNDQAETVIMNIMRGTGMEGLKGMEYKRGKIIRPMLDIRRSEIEEYCEILGLKPRIDSTNLESIYTRNNVRLELIPYIRENFDVDIVESVTRMAELIRDDSSFLDIAADEKYKECVINTRATKATTANAAELDTKTRAVELDVNKIIKCHNAIRKRVIRKAIERVKGDLNSIESIHVKKTIDLCINGRTGSTIHLPRNVRAAKSYSVLRIYIDDSMADSIADSMADSVGDSIADSIAEKLGKSPKDLSSFNKKIEIPGITNIEILNACLKAAVIKREEFDVKIFNNLSHDSFVQFFDYDKLKEGINIRGRKEGDIFFPYKCKGREKLKEFFIDTKIPREKRSRLPLVAKGKDIVWVIGYKISDAYKITENTKKVLKLEFVELKHS